MRKNILILYTNYGTGHYMAAKALEEYLNKYKNYNVQVLDPLTFSRPIINKLFAKVGNIVSTKFRRFRGKLYQEKMYKNYLKNSWFFILCTKLFWTKKLYKRLLDFNPDIIISTQVGPTGLIAAHKHLLDVKLVSVFTDYGLHRMYTIGNEFVDKFCVPNKEIKQQMMEIGIDKEKIEVTGIPVRSKFLETKPKDISKLIKENELPQKNPLLLFVCGGGLGYDNAFAYFKKLLECDYDFSYVFISGKNNKLYDKAKDLSEKYNKDGKVLGYVENIDELMKCCDMVFGKPGGIITSETLNLGKPLCAVEPIPGQETKNSLFLVNNHFGFYITSIKEFDTFLENLKHGKINLKECEKNIQENFIKFSFIDLEEI